MKKIFFILLLFATANVAFAQQKYYPFSINGKHGITDNQGNEVMKPTYAFATEIPAKGQIYLQDFSDRPDIIVNNKTGAKQLYERILNNQVQIKDVGYSVITNKGKKYLLSEESEKNIPITRDYDDFKTVGQVIIADYYAQDPYVSGGKDKNGIPMPPKIREMKKHHVVLANDVSLKTILDKGFNKYLPLYKIDEDEEDKGIVRMVTVKLDDFEKKPNFDYIVLSQGNNHKLYNDKMVLVKAFVLAKADEEMLLDFCKKTLKQNLSSVSENRVGGTVSAPPMMVGPSMGTARNSDSKPVEKKPFVPYFYVKKIENGNTIFALQETEEISKRIFEAKPTSAVKFYKSDNYIDVKIAGKEDSRFYFDRKTGEIYLPKAYLAGLGITLI